jgi:TetR/AcrR family transcriptional repressor of nem operon
MSYPAEHRHLTKQKIVRSARQLFNRRGFDTVSIDDVMADAGLTRGSFYSYFESKGDLDAEAVTQILDEKQLLSSDGVSIDPRAVDSAAQFIRDYLSREHFEDIDGTCPLIAFPTDFLRDEHRVRQAFETVLRVMIDIFEQALQRNGQTARCRARAIATLCVGGMVLARSIEDRVLADEIREAAMPSRCRSDRGRAERRMSGDRRRKRSWFDCFRPMVGRRVGMIHLVSCPMQGQSHVN